jgi:hypothetical protein
MERITAATGRLSGCQRLIAAKIFSLIAAGLLAGPARGADEQLELTVVDRDSGRPIPCRMHLRRGTETGRPWRVKRLPFWHDHFVFPGQVTLELPLGNYFFEIERGPEYAACSGYFTINRYSDDAKQIQLTRGVDMAAAGWWSGDLDVRRDVRDMELLMAAEDLHVAQVITWLNDKNQWEDRDPPDNPLLRFDGDRYCQVMAGGHDRPGGSLLYFNLPGPLKSPGTNREYPSLLDYAQDAREHENAWIDVSRPYAWDLPMLVAHDMVDSVQVAHGQLCRSEVIDDESGGYARDRELYPGVAGNARWSQQIYFHLLECGLRIPPTAGSGSGESPNPVGYNRVYVHTGSELSYEAWWENLRAGRVYVTNGPLLQPVVDGELPGEVFHADRGETLELQPALTLSLLEPDRHLYIEVVKNGRVEHSVPFDEYKEARGRLPKLHFDNSGWFLIRVVTDEPKTYRYAMTGPYYVQIGYEPRISRRSAQFFLDWVYRRARQIKLAGPDHQAQLIDAHRQARDFWQNLLDRANAD